MKNSIFSIIGLCLIAVSAILGYFVNVNATVIISIVGAFSGATLIVMDAVKKAKKEGNLDWKLWVAVIGASIGGCLCAIGGVSENVITSVVGAVITIITIIMSVIVSKKEIKKEVEKE